VEFCKNRVRKTVIPNPRKTKRIVKEGCFFGILFTLREIIEFYSHVKSGSDFERFDYFVESGSGFEYLASQAPKSSWIEGSMSERATLRERMRC